MQTVVVIAALVALVLVLRLLATRGETVRLPAEQTAALLTDDSVRELVLRGRKIEAIKAYRKLHGVDLKDAKQAVDRLSEGLSGARGTA